MSEKDTDLSKLFYGKEAIHYNARGIQFYTDEVAAKLQSLGWVREPD